MKLGPMEMVIILVIVLLVFGPGKLPDIAASIGKSLKAFRQGQTGEVPEERAPKAKLAKQTRRKTTINKVVPATTEESKKVDDAVTSPKS